MMTNYLDFKIVSFCEQVKPHHDCIAIENEQHKKIQWQWNFSYADICDLSNEEIVCIFKIKPKYNEQEKNR